MDRKETFNRVLALKPGKIALLVIDMQEGFLSPGSAMEVPQGREIIPAIRRLAESCRRVGAPVIYTGFVYSPSVPTLIGQLHVEHKPIQPGTQPGFGRPSSCCTEGDGSVQVVPELAPEPGEAVIEKPGYDAFYDSTLDSVLRGKGIENLIVTGVMTDVCVLATVTGAVHRGYKVTVVRDGVATLWPEVQEVLLSLMERAYARVMTADEVVEEVSR